MNDLAELQKKMDVLDELNEIESMVTNNKIIFVHKKENFRVRRLTLADRQELRAQQNTKLNELRANPDYKSTKQIYDELKEKGIDIAEIDKDMRLSIKQLEELGKKCIDANEFFQDKIRDQLYELKNQIIQLSQEKSDHLQYSIESELGTSFAEYLTYLVLEKETPEGYKKYFEKYEDYAISEEEDLIQRAAIYSSHLVMRPYTTEE